MYIHTHTSTHVYMHTYFHSIIILVHMLTSYSSLIIHYLLGIHKKIAYLLFPLVEITGTERRKYIIYDSLYKSKPE